MKDEILSRTVMVAIPGGRSTVAAVYDRRLLKALLLISAVIDRRYRMLGAAVCCLLLPLTAHAKLNVVATTPDLAAIAQAIGGERAEVRSLARPMEDAHFVQAKPSFILALNRADVLIEGGAELESGWLSVLLESARNPKIAAGAAGRVVCARGVELLEVPSELDRSKGDVHAMGNPHFLVDPVNAKLTAEHICDAFCKLDAASSGFYRANLAEFTKRLEAKLAEWQAALAPFEGAHVVSYHNTWPYFARRFGLRMKLFLEPKPGIPPSPAHLAGVIEKMREEKIRVIVVEPYQNRRTAEMVAGRTGAVVLDFAQYPGGVKGTEGGYVELMDHLVAALVKALKGGE